MGSCVSLHRHSNSTVKNASKVTSINGGEKPIALSDDEELGPGSGEYGGSKDEAFYDTQAWLASDGEDDFYSVHGDFTPSRSSTPNFQRSAPGTPRLTKGLSSERLPESKGETSPFEKKKKLADFLKESFQAELLSNNQSTLSGRLASSHHALKSDADVPLTTLSSNNGLHEKSPNGYSKPGTEKNLKSSQCCLPALTHKYELGDKKQNGN